jgi:hypothetical protein
MITEPRIWSDNDEDMHDEIVGIARKSSTEFIRELSDPVIRTRAVKSAYADGFRCGLLWAIDNPFSFFAIVVRSFWRRIRGKNQLSPSA